MYNLQNSNKNYVKPFPPLSCITEFPFLDYTFDKVTDWGIMQKLAEKLNEIIKITNDTTVIVTELKNFVNNYFNNLDVQEEINNKLDKMAQDGTLQEIISQFINLNALWCFNSLNDMKQATNLIKGSFAKTLGYYEANDGGENIYKIIENSNEIVIDDATYILLENGFVAELQYNNIIKTKTFGTKNNGTDDDSIYLKKCHEFANEHNLTVLYNSEEYHIKKFYNIQVTTNVDFGDATIYLYENNNTEDNNYFMTIPKENEVITVNDPTYCGQLINDLKKGKISYHLTQKSIIRIFDNTKFFYKRTGVNANNGIAYQDIIIADRDGSIIRGLDYEFSNITSFNIYKIEETELILKNANFVNLGNSQSYGNDYLHAGIYVLRSNVTFDNINYKVNETGNNQQSDGIVRLTLAYNFTYKNSKIDSRINSHSSYSMTLSFSILIHLENIINNDIMNSNKWGVMGNNFIKDVYVNNCTLNRFDSHQGAFNVFIDNSNIGYGLIRLVGKGILQVTNTIVRGNSFIFLRDDYGATFEGDIIIKNCKLDNTINNSNFARIISSTFNITHDYGYELYLGKNNIIIEDFEFINKNSSNPAYVFYLPIRQSNESYNGNMYLANNIKLKNIVSIGFKGIYPITSSMINLLKSKKNGKVTFASNGNSIVGMNYNTVIELNNIKIENQDVFLSTSSNNIIYNDSPKDVEDIAVVNNNDIIPIIKILNMDKIRISDNNRSIIKYVIENSIIYNINNSNQLSIIKNSILQPNLVSVATILVISLSSILDNVTFMTPNFQEEHDLIQEDLKTIYNSIGNWFDSSQPNYTFTNLSNCNFDLTVFNLIRNDLRTLLSNPYNISARERVNVT